MVLVASRKYGKVAVLGNLCYIDTFHLFFTAIRLHIRTVKKIATRSFCFLNGQCPKRKHVLSVLCIEAVP